MHIFKKIKTLVAINNLAQIYRTNVVFIDIFFGLRGKIIDLIGCFISEQKNGHWGFIDNAKMIPDGNSFPDLHD